MEFIQTIASLWNEFLIMGICSGIISFILLMITTLLASHFKLISSLIVAIPLNFFMVLTKITSNIGLFLGVIQLILKLL